ncbi:hypothetical protein ABZS98_39800 [Streptomyces avermitilis]|uniref:hypothetical protein n=1 Tax=Streptomyces avermitilis TaxID=33903 RepID=UPI0033BD0C47
MPVNMTGLLRGGGTGLALREVQELAVALLLGVIQRPGFRAVAMSGVGQGVVDVALGAAHEASRWRGSGVVAPAFGLDV